MPFSLRIFAALAPYFGGHPLGSVDALYHLMSFCESQRDGIGHYKGDAHQHLWMARTNRVVFLLSFVLVSCEYPEVWILEVVAGLSGYLRVILLGTVPGVVQFTEIGAAIFSGCTKPYSRSNSFQAAT